MILLLLFALLTTASPDTLTLEQAYREAEDAYPLRRQLSVHDSMSELRLENLRVNYLPTISLRSQAIYYSDVAEISIPTPGANIPAPSHDQYKIAVGIDQLVYDGGVTKQLQALESIQRDLEKGKVAVELYKLREQVNVAYFGVLMFDAQSANLDLLQKDLESKLNVVKSLVQNGAVLPSNADVLSAELVSIRQQRIEVRASRQSAIGVLEELLGRPVDLNTVLLLPANAMPDDHPGRERPEYRLFDASRSALAGQTSLINRRKRPQIALFTETAFGRPPGLNLFESDFKPFYSAGLRVNWNPWSWNRSRRERQILHFQSDLIDAEEMSFSKQVRIATRQQLADITKFDELIATDAEVLELREEIARQSASQLQNGVITATDYLVDRNAASRAQLARRIHQIQRVQAKVRYLTTIGK